MGKTTEKEFDGQFGCQTIKKEILNLLHTIKIKARVRSLAEEVLEQKQAPGVRLGLNRG